MNVVAYTTTRRNAHLGDTPVKALAPGAEVIEIAFVAENSTGESPVLSLPSPIPIRAVRTTDASKADLSLLTIPIEDGDVAEVTMRARRWVEHPTGDLSEQNLTSATSLMTSVQGAHVIWSPGRAAILAPPAKLSMVRDAFLEAAYFEGELRDIEHQLHAAWPQLDQDVPSGFEFKVGAARRRKLRERFQEVMRLRAKLARITPMLLAPHVYPPTVASQTGERIRERARVEARVEWLGEQLEVFEKIYEMSSERASSYLHARSSNILEWVIIVLLLAQLVLSFYEGLM